MIGVAAVERRNHVLLLPFTGCGPPLKMPGMSSTGPTITPMDVDNSSGGEFRAEPEAAPIIVVTDEYRTMLELLKHQEKDASRPQRKGLFPQRFR